MKNWAQFQKGYSLIELQKDYGTEEQCEKALFKPNSGYLYLK